MQLAFFNLSPSRPPSVAQRSFVSEMKHGNLIKCTEEKPAVLNSSPCPVFVYPADCHRFLAQGATMVTCPEPLPAPGVGLGLLLPLDEKIDLGNPHLSWCICSLEEEAVPRAGARDVLWSSPCWSCGQPWHGAPFCYSALLSAQMVPRWREGWMDGERSVLLRGS